MSKSSDLIDAKLDGWLSDWPAPERDDDAWENFGSRLDDRLAEVSVGRGEEAWLQAPFPAMAGEGTTDSAKPDVGGGRKRSDRPQSERRRRKSLKDFAERVSAPLAPLSGPGSTQTPTQKNAESSVPAQRAASTGSRAACLRASSASFVSRPTDARDSDSGIVHLDAVRSSAQSLPDTGALPAKQTLSQGESNVSPTAPASARKSLVLPVAGGGLVAVLALAAAAILVVRSQGHHEDMAAEAQPAAAPVEAMGTAVPKPMVGTNAPVASGLSPEGFDIASEEAPPVIGTVGGPRLGGAVKVEKSENEDKATNRDEASKDNDNEPKDPRDLAGVMGTAVGNTRGKKGDGSDSAKGPEADPSSIPDAPSQGAIQGALGSVKGAARGCVAGMDAPSRASVTFGSDGTVSNVSVSGAAAGTPAESCVRSALTRARVGPFKRSSFTVGVTLRP